MVQYMCVLKPKKKLKLNIGVLINGNLYFFNNFCLFLHLSSGKTISSTFKFFLYAFHKKINIFKSKFYQEKKNLILLKNLINVQ